KLHIEDISLKCRKKVESFKEKDLVYTIGYIEKKSLKYLWFVYGDCISGNRNTYIQLQNAIKEPIEQLRDSGLYDMTEGSKELARFKGIDLLKRSNMRVRNMFEL